MAFTRVNPLGWALFEELTSAQMNQLDINVSRAIDGTFGGTYNPSSPITINGTLVVDNLQADTITNDTGTWTNLTVNNDLDVNNNLTVDGTSTFNGQTVFNDPVTFNDTQQFNGSVGHSVGNYLFNSSGSMSVINGYFVVSGGGQALFSSDVTFQSSSDVLVQGDWEFDGNVTVAFGSSFVFDNTPVFVRGMTATGGTVDFQSAGSVRLPGSVTKYSGSFIEYSTNQTIYKYYPAKTQLARAGSWDADTYFDQVYHGIFDAASCYFAFDVPRRCVGFNAVALYFNCSDNPAGGGMTLTAYSKTNQGNISQIAMVTQPVGSHAGDNILSLGAFSFSSLDQLFLRVEAPIGNAGASNTELHQFRLDCVLAGMGSW